MLVKVNMERVVKSINAHIILIKDDQLFGGIFTISMG